MESIKHSENILLLLYLIAPTLISGVCLLFLFGLYIMFSMFLGRPGISFRNTMSSLAAFISLGILGTIAGYLTGLSREPAVGALVPAALSLVGAFGIYLVSRKEQKQGNVFLATIGLSVFLVLGALAGAQQRTVAEKGLERENAREVVRREFIQRQMRRSLRLDEGNCSRGWPGSSGA